MEDGFVALNHVGGVFEDHNGEIWVMYQAKDMKRPFLSSGAERHPLMLSKIEFDNSGWPVSVVKAKGGWNYPKFPK
ncbi:MAG: hypothetical protein HC906_05690 [Bacteroidales bacterium]|nr:hypothetical protein [Bacteroidales bacterium]